MTMRYVRVAVITFVCGLILLAVVAAVGYLWFQGSRWKGETERYAESAGRLEAMKLFEHGYRWKYVVDGKRDETEPLNRKDGAFDVFAVVYQPVLGPAHKDATERYVKAFNDQMEAMSASGAMRFPNSGNVGDAQAAKEIAKAVLRQLLTPKDFSKKELFEAALKDGVWTVSCSEPKFRLNFPVVIQIRQKTGAIIKHDDPNA